jgi:hypothetical protein
MTSATRSASPTEHVLDRGGSTDEELTNRRHDVGAGVYVARINGRHGSAHGICEGRYTGDAELVHLQQGVAPQVQEVGLLAESPLPRSVRSRVVPLAP